MRQAMTIGVAAGLTAFALLPTAWAGSLRGAADPAVRPSVAALAANGAQNVPDLQGCVRWCQRDLNPCDPPEFKRTDGRCGEP